MRTLPAVKRQSGRMSVAGAGGVMLAALLLVFQPAKADAGAAFSDAAAGTAAMDFLNLGVGARAMAMGGAYTAIAEDASACYWNPAGLVQINKFSATFMRANYVGDITYQYAAYAQRLNPYSVIGVSAMLTDIGSIDRTDTVGNRTGEFNPRDQAYSLTYSRAIVELSDKDHDVAIGVSGRYINSKIVDSADAYGFDVGMMGFYFAEIPYRLGVVVQNLGRGPKFDTEYNSLPLKARFGGSLSPFHNFLVSSDVVFPKGGQYYFTLGSELGIAPPSGGRVSLRAGLNSQQLKITGGTSGLSLGAGVSFQLFNIDLAYVSMGELGNALRFSLSFDFPLWEPVFQRKDKTVFADMQQFTSMQQLNK
ncbi:MAG: PorV/PorQ family protein [Elusimicrobiales bacterium]|nr:PorV/PorQ family protein [Elusimicrobiales bacterium]